MTSLRSIADVSSGIWKGCSNRPSRSETQFFDDDLRMLDIKEFIVYNFVNHPTTALRELLLSTFEFWKALSLEDWKQIFSQLSGNELAEYHMVVISNQYLGIDPAFESTRDVEIAHITPSDGRVQSGRPALFIDCMEGELRRIEQEYLQRDFGLTIHDFVQLRKRLTGTPERS